MTGPVLRCASPWGTTLTLRENALVIRERKRGEETLEAMRIQSVRLDPPHGIDRGCLRVTTAEGESRYAFRRAEYVAAAALHAQLMGMLGPGQPEEPDGGAVANGLVKLKGLLDSGALTPEEFETAKKKLLE